MTTDHRALPALPLLVLPPPGRFLSPVALDHRAAAALGSARAALGELRLAFAGDSADGGPIARAVCDARQELAALGRALAGHLVDPDPLVADRSDLHDVYMGVRRRVLTPAATLAEVVPVLTRAVDDLAVTRIDVNDVVAEIDGMLTVLPEHPVAVDRAAPVATDRQRERAGHRVGGTGLERWVAMHHVYAVFCLALADRIEDVLAALGRGDHDGAAAHLDGAATIVAAATGTMVHASSLSAAHYQGVVRPTMHPPFAPVALGGSMNADNTVARAAVERLLATLDEPYPDLVAAHPRLAAARDRFLVHDLLDAERHITVAAGLIGDDTSLLQHPEGPTNAVGFLRLSRHRRAARYAPMMRFGDRRLGGRTTPALVR